MKMQIKIISTLLLAGLGLPARAYTWFTEAALLASFFPGQAPSHEAWTLSAEEAEAFKALVGYAPPQDGYEWFVAPDGSGLALIDEQLGQHEPITFGVKLGADCRIQRIEVMVYREQYGDGVRSEAFRRQFVGRDASQPMRAGKDIQIVSGATVSSRSLATGARRASALCQVWAQP